MLTSVAYSQNRVTIHVVNENDKPLSGAVAYVLGLDSLFIHSAITNEEGIINMPSVDFQKEMIKILAFGYNSFDIWKASADNTIKVKLNPLNIELSEVIVNANSNIIQKNDRIVFNVANENLTKGNNSYELIKFTPFIVVDNSDKLSIIGKSGVQLYINGRKTNVPESSISSYLSSLPAEKIASIEVITSPGATIRTNGNEGIINLVLKKNEADGLNGTLTLNDSQRKTNSQDGGIYLNYQKNKLNVSVNAYGNNNNGSDQLVYDYYYMISNNHQRLISDEKTKYKELAGSLRVDYNLSDRQILGMVLNSSYTDDGRNTTDQTTFGKRNTTLIDSILHSDNRIATPVQNYSANLNYRLKVSEKGDLAVDVDYLWNIRKQHMQTNFSRIEIGMQLSPYDRFEQTSEDLMNSYSGKIEYRHTFNNTTNIVAGIETYASASEANFFYGNLQNGVYVSDPQKTNTFSYNEMYRGGYISFSRAWTPKFNSRIEANLELIDSKGIQQVTSEEIKRTYVDLRPSVSLQYQFNPANRLSYNLNFFVARPGFYSLNPFRFYLSPTVYKEYNPDLKPSNSYINVLNYNLKGHYIFNLEHMYIKDCANNFLIPVDDQYTKYINANYGDTQMFSFVFIWNDSFWENRVYANASIRSMYLKYKGEVESIVVNNEGTSYVFSLSGGVQISKRYDWNLTGNFVYESEVKLAHENAGDRYRFSVGMRKKISQGISLNFGVRDFLFNNAARYNIDDNYEYYLNPKYDFRTFYVSISLSFGNMKAKGASGRRSSSSTVKNRLKE
jgi:hypothetical protein